MNNVLNSLMTDSTDIAFDLVNERVNSLFESAPKPKAHSSNHVNKKTFKEWTEVCVFKKNKTTLSYKRCQEQRDKF